MAGLSVAYAVLRLAHLLCYVNDVPTVRSLIFFAGALSVIGIYLAVLVSA